LTKICFKKILVLINNEKLIIGVNPTNIFVLSMFPIFAVKLEYLFHKKTIHLQ
jgi:hypothetical protein